MSWFSRKPKPEPEPLKPGTCECGHRRCNHSGGVGVCCAAIAKSNEWPDGGGCACRVYIRDDDDDDDGDDEPETPSPEELERMYRL